MIINIDAKAIEWYCIVWFAQDKVGMKEIWEELDQHTLNQQTFGLPERRIAKIFVFRLIYGGSAWSYCFDPDFNWISKDHKYWQRVIDAFYKKYSGIKETHEKWIHEAKHTGKLVMPTGRFYPFAPFPDPRGGLKWPLTQIVNYPVQGLANDLVTIARVSLAKRLTSLNDARIKLISTVHDSIVLDIPDELVGKVVSVVDGVFNDIPANFHRLFGVEFNLPVRYELSVGPNLMDLTELK